MLKPIFFQLPDKSIDKLDPLEIHFIGITKNYAKFYFKDRTYTMIRTTLKNLMTKLPTDIFIQINRSWAVSVFYIDSIVERHVFIGKEAIPVSPEFYDSLISKLQIINWDEPKTRKRKSSDD